MQKPQLNCKNKSSIPVAEPTPSNIVNSMFGLC